MKYFVRSIKYFFYFAIITTLIIFALILIGAVEGDINAIFNGGYEALWKMALFFALVAAVYPKVGFITRTIHTDREWKDIKETLCRHLEERRYDLESENGDVMTFRFHSITGRLSKMYEDRITILKTDEGFSMEGLRKDVMRLSAGIEDRLASQAEDEA
ncbi:MAG: hypothetical protein IJ005_09115 [Bacteroidales bacterium]|nr:hypothetical protein [Bacteroidales bacterium]